MVSLSQRFQKKDAGFLGSELKLVTDQWIHTPSRIPPETLQAAFRFTTPAPFRSFEHSWSFISFELKFPFTQDAEVLPNVARKKWNTLLPIGVFTQHCKQLQATSKDLQANLRANLLTSPVWTGPNTRTSEWRSEWLMGAGSGRGNTRKRKWASFTSLALLILTPYSLISSKHCAGGSLFSVERLWNATCRAHEGEQVWSTIKGVQLMLFFFSLCFHVLASPEILFTAQEWFLQFATLRNSCISFEFCRVLRCFLWCDREEKDF